MPAVHKSCNPIAMLVNQLNKFMHEKHFPDEIVVGLPFKLRSSCFSSFLSLSKS